MDVSFIVVNYNTTSLTEACIDSIYTFTKGVSFEVWLVDNASPDRSVLSLPDKFPGLQLIALEENIGFGAGNNVAVEQAKGEFVFLLNSDTELQSDAATVFARFMYEPGNRKVAVCGGHLFTPTGVETPSYGNFPSIFQAFSSVGPYLLYKNYYYRHLDTGVPNRSDKMRSVDFITGADMFIRRSVLKECGAFDPDFFLYFEETELCKRIRRSGYDIMLLPSVRILHHEAGSGAKQGFNAFSFLHFERSKRLYYRKVHGILYMWVASLFNMVGVILHSLFGKRKGNLIQKMKLFRGRRAESPTP